MDAKLTVLIVLVTLGLLVDHTSADFFYNRPAPKAEDLEMLNLKCIPGRTIMKVEEKKAVIDPVPDDSEEFTRTKQSSSDAEEGCLICICSTEGRDEYCTKRATGTVNECMVIHSIMSKREEAEPFNLLKSLPYRIRRDLIWHNDEIPYNPDSKCYRGHSYYSNHDTPNDTDINYKEEEMTSLLDYKSETACYYCVCSVSGDEAGCISRSIWFCNYLRYLRSDKAQRDMYASLFQQDRPAYFRQLSFRLRRTLDDSLFNLIEKGTGGEVSQGSRRHLEVQKKCVPYVSTYSDCNAFNQCDGCTKCLCTAGGYWDCRPVKICDENDENDIDDEMFDAALEQLEFDMKKFKKNQEKYAPDLNGLLSEGMNSKSKQLINLIENIDKSNKLNDTLGKNKQPSESISSLEKNNESDLPIYTVEQKERQREESFKPPPVITKLVPDPPGPKRKETDDLLDEMGYRDPTVNINQFITKRQKRSAVKKNTVNKHNKRSAEKANNRRPTRNSNKINDTIKFYSTVDELNEDTLRHSNLYGTLLAKKIDLKVLPNLSRRSNIIEKSNKSLHIDFNEHNHITDNKIDALDHESKFDLSHEKLNVIPGNYTQKNKDKELSKLVVNELKPGNEIVGDSKAPVTSNITFTLENDTLTAMAYIAGNLLNKLWTMEKDSTGSTLETEDMKHEKISELLDLFKEPLNLKQETFLKNVLERLSSAIDTDKDIKNGTICQTIEEARQLIHNYDNPRDAQDTNATVKQLAPCSKDKSSKITQYATAKAISKINNVLGLLKTFENIQSNLSQIKTGTEFPMEQALNFTHPISRKLVMDTILTKNEATSLNTYGNLLDKITKMLLPKKDSERITKVIKESNMLNDNENFRNNYMKMFKTDLKNMTITAKDKIVLDYLTHINSKPNCVLNKINPNSNILPTIESNILLNLSEIFKMKSLGDLIKLLEPAKVFNNTNVHTTTTTIKPVVPTTVIPEKITVKNSRVDDPKKFASTREKLKSHLRTIIEDLIELQDAKGIRTKGNIKIADALPCIYNIMNAGKALNKNNEEKKEADRITEMFKELRLDMRSMQTRRNNEPLMQVRPKSAVVLERVIKSLSQKYKPKTRRFFNAKSHKSFNQVKNTIYKLRNISSTYKNQALYTEVPAAERIVLLKALQEEVKNYIAALEGIKHDFHNLTKMPADQFSELATFILTSAANITLNEKVMTKIENMRPKKSSVDRIVNRIDKTTSPELLGRLNANDYNDNDMKISRYQILNHLIKKRVEIYMKLKEAKEFDVESNMNYNVAKRVLFYLNNGNYNLAHELFKMLVMQKQDVPDVPAINGRRSMFAVPTQKPANNPIYQREVPRSLAPFEEPKILDNESKYMSQDHLIKQLLNIKNMGI